MTLKQLIRYTNAPAIEATWVDESDGVIKCQAYSHHPEQMAMLRADLGADAAQYEDMIAEVEATYVPPEPEPITVPPQITRAQGKVVLLQLGLWQPALDYVAGLTDPLAKATGEVALHDTTYWSRSSPFLNAAAEALGLSSADLDALFVTASEIIL